jgi:hypothetical protein
MPKAFITPAYTFTPGLPGVGTVALSIADFDVKRLAAIINQTRGVVIYATGSDASRYTALAGSTLTLNVDTSTHNANDALQVIYEDATSLAPTVAPQTDDLVRMLSRLVKILECNAVVDQQQRQRVTLDAMTGGLTLAALTTVTTVTTVSTVSAVTNQVAMAGMDREQYINIAKNTYANAIRPQLTFV